MKRIFIYPGGFILLLAAALTSCYPDEADNITDLDIVQTQYDENFDFNTKEYFLLPDTVPLITAGESYEKSPQEIQMDEKIIEEIVHYMELSGYTRLSEADTSDNQKMQNALVILASRAIVSYTDYYYNYYNYGYDYWGGYYGLNYYYPGYNWNNYYPWGYPVSYSYSVGTVIIEMLDPSDPRQVDDTNSEVTYPVRWMAVLNGLAELSYLNTQERITDGIRQAFEQSPYLDKEP